MEELLPLAHPFVMPNISIIIANAIKQIQNIFFHFFIEVHA